MKAKYVRLVNILFWAFVVLLHVSTGLSIAGIISVNALKVIFGVSCLFMIILFQIILDNLHVR